MSSRLVQREANRSNLATPMYSLSLFAASSATASAEDDVLRLWATVFRMGSSSSSNAKNRFFFLIIGSKASFQLSVRSIDFTEIGKVQIVHGMMRNKMNPSNTARLADTCFVFGEDIAWQALNVPSRTCHRQKAFDNEFSKYSLDGKQDRVSRCIGRRNIQGGVGQLVEKHLSVVNAAS